eukprot:CAMPEP_0184380636 /NCGR_PEP_ID=MMETSP0007-20130409/4916_1 /TAXON_ID=97485 /ORGANISM="Prymnesium parvum, Strain Texoma1" /LENGTH=108 /DNA_ID=CAMNT_0026725949 /DNA_START=1017 /DNA_END=1338 /DNA_ORIENTATION=+
MTGHYAQVVLQAVQVDPKCLRLLGFPEGAAVAAQLQALPALVSTPVAPFHPESAVAGALALLRLPHRTAARVARHCRCLVPSEAYPLDSGAVGAAQDASNAAPDAGAT